MMQLKTKDENRPSEPEIRNPKAERNPKPEIRTNGKNHRER
jgi:hypothetical protein